MLIISTVYNIVLKLRISSSRISVFHENLLVFSEASTVDIIVVRNQIHFDCICRTERGDANEKKNIEEMFPWIVYDMICTRSKGKWSFLFSASAF